MAIKKQTRLKSACNAGALEIQCFHIIGSTGKKDAVIGDIIIGAVKSAIPGMTVKKSDIVKAVVVRTRQNLRRKDGSYISFGDNAAVIIKNVEDKEPVGTRVFGPVGRELKERGFNEIVSRAVEVV